MPAIDTLIRPRWIAPVGGKQRLLTEHAIAVHDGRITTVLPHAAADEQFSAAETIELTDHIVLPGLVNCHTHAAKSLLRGIVNDQPLMPWLQQHIWPAEEAHVSPAFVADGTALAMAEMIRGGTTCFNDMYHFPDTTARSAMHAGLRAAIGLLVIDQPTAWAANADQYIDKAIAVHDGFARHPLLTTLFAPHAPYTVSDRLLSRVRVLADELDLRVHMHIHETATELQQAEDGVRPLTRLHRLGLLGPGLLAAHMTQLTRDEIDLCAEHGVHVLHCPESNLKLASGLCPVQQLLDSDINVALGTDGAAANNDLDMLGEMRTAALLGKLAADDAAALCADDALHMATLGGARALGLADDIGSIENGKAADLCAIDLSALETQPLFDPIETLVYSADRQQVTDTWVAGRRLLHDRRLTTLDETAIRDRARHWQQVLATDA